MFCFELHIITCHLSGDDASIKVWLIAPQMIIHLLLERRFDEKFSLTHWKCKVRLHDFLCTQSEALAEARLRRVTEARTILYSNFNMALHSAAQKHLFASKLRDLFSTSPFVFVYQTLGNIRATVLTTGMQKELEKQLPASGVTAACFRTKNTVARASDSCINPFFLASNLVVGWQMAQTGQHLSSAGQGPEQAGGGGSSGSGSSMSTPKLMSAGSSGKLGAPAPEIRARYGNSLQEILGDLSQAPGLPDRIPHATLSTLIRLSLQLPDRHPVALLACFYRGSHVGLGSLRRWAKLDENQVGVLSSTMLPSSVWQCEILGNRTVAF